MNSVEKMVILITNVAVAIALGFALGVWFFVQTLGGLIRIDVMSLTICVIASIVALVLINWLIMAIWQTREIDAAKHTPSTI